MVIDSGLCECMCPLYLCTLPFSFKKETFSREKKYIKQVIKKTDVRVLISENRLLAQKENKEDI